MNPSALTSVQQQALLDLAMLAMYADGHLASSEDARVLRLLTALGYNTDYDRGRLYDVAVTRVRQHLTTADAASSYARELAAAFPDAGQRRDVHDLLTEILSSDNRVAPQEATFLTTVRQALAL
jgi:uncharacterized tellurite resistance protein B-like protein